MLMQAATGLIETWFVAWLGTDALTGMALVFPGFMMMQMISAGAMGGGISSAVARALGAGGARMRRRWRSTASSSIGRSASLFSLLVVAFGRPLYRALGGEGASLEARSPTRTSCSPERCWYGCSTRSRA
jgi:Na+-driven multidrug efflux pump